MAQAQHKIKAKAAPITIAPTGLLLGEACHHLSHNRFIRFATNLWMIAVEFIAAGLLVVLAPALAMDALIGCAFLFLALVTAYLVWYGRFIRRIRIHKPLCPHCTSRIWQLCCGRCREPVPALALWLWGMFLTHCPHCDFRLSCRKQTLLAWCSTCSSSLPRPDLLFNKPTHVIVWVATSLPSKIKGGWKPLREGEHSMALYQHGEKNAALLMYIRDDYKTMENPVEEHLMNQTRLLLVSRDVPEAHVERIRGRFDTRIENRTLFEKVSPIK